MGHPPRNPTKPRDPDLAGAEIAIQRAALKVREKARRIGRGVIVWRDGEIVEDRGKISTNSPSPTYPQGKAPLSNS